MHLSSIYPLLIMRRLLQAFLTHCRVELIRLPLKWVGGFFTCLQLKLSKEFTNSFVYTQQQHSCDSVMHNACCKNCELVTMVICLTECHVLLAKDDD